MKNLIFTINKINEQLENNYQEYDSIINFLNASFIKVIDSLNIVSASNTKDLMLILNVNRDKRNNLREEFSKLNFKNIKSVYINLNNKLSNVFGDPFIQDYINNFVFQIFPNSNYKNEALSKFYSDIKFFSPKGKTRTAIVFNSNNGIIPVHVFNLYNKTYCVDEDIDFYKNSKTNLKLNKINNVLSYNLNYSVWINNFINGHYKTPGKKINIGNFIFSYNDFNNVFLNFIDNTKPESILVYNEDDFNFEIKNYNISKDIKSYNSVIKKYKLNID